MPTVDSRDVQAQLSRILSSPQFERAGRLSIFLRFIVEEVVAGRAASIKESVIGVQVFGRPSGWNPKNDSTVRTQATRLREKLRDYYLTDGARDELVLELPKGSYVPLWRVARRETRPRWLKAASVLACLVAAGPVLWHWKTRPPIQSIAVLPLDNLSGNAEDDPLAAGLAEDLIRQLAGLPDIRVLSHTSSFALHGKGKSIREIGKLLDVEAVLEGTLQRDGQKIKITAQLVRSGDDRTLWSGAFEREARDLFALESDLSSRIAHTLNASLRAGTSTRNVNSDAYALYLRGIHAIRATAPGSTQEAIPLLQQAVEKDPMLAHAWSAQAYVWAHVRIGDFPNVVTKARHAALRALEIDARAPEAHAALGFIQFYCDGDRNAAEQSFRKALQFGPNSYEAWEQYAQYLMDTGRLREARDAMQHGQRLDPLSPHVGFVLAAILLVGHQYDGAIEESRKVLERYPEFHQIYQHLGGAYLEKGMCAEALDALEKYGDRAVQAAAMARCGQREEAQRTLAALEAEAASGRVQSALGAARVYTALGDHQRALDYLERIKDRGYIQQMRKPSWDPLRNEPRFIAMRKQFGLN